MQYAKFDLQQWMPEELRHAFLARLKHRVYRAGQSIYRQNSPGIEMYRLISGTVKISVLRPDGHQITYTLFEPGDCFGQTSLIDGCPRPQSTEAASVIEVGVLTLTDFRTLCETYPAFLHAVACLLSAQLRVLAQNYEMASLDALPVRIVRKILQIHLGSPRPLSAGAAPCVHLSQSELAAMVGVSRQSVNRVLAKLQRDGLIQRDYGALRIVDLTGLLNLSMKT